MSEFTPPRECPCWTKSHCRYHDSESSDHAPCCPIQVHNDALDRDRLRADLAAALKAKEEACDLIDALLVGKVGSQPNAMREQVRALRSIDKGGDRG